MISMVYIQCSIRFRWWAWKVLWIWLITSLNTFAWTSSPPRVVWLVPMETHIEGQVSKFRTVHVILVMQQAACRGGGVETPHMLPHNCYWVQCVDIIIARELLVVVRHVFARVYLGSQASDRLLPVCCTITCSHSDALVSLEISRLFAGCFPLPIST